MRVALVMGLKAGPQMEVRQDTSPLSPPPRYEVVSEFVHDKA